MSYQHNPFDLEAGQAPSAPLINCRLNFLICGTYNKGSRHLQKKSDAAVLADCKSTVGESAFVASLPQEASEAAITAAAPSRHVLCLPASFPTPRASLILPPVVPSHANGLSIHQNQPQHQYDAVHERSCACHRPAQYCPPSCSRRLGWLVPGPCYPCRCPSTLSRRDNQLHDQGLAATS
jgi:hypothetical protein